MLVLCWALDVQQLISSAKFFMVGVIIIIPTLQMRVLRLKEVEQLAWGCQPGGNGMWAWAVGLHHWCPWAQGHAQRPEPGHTHPSTPSPFIPETLPKRVVKTPGRGAGWQIRRRSGVCASIFPWLSGPCKLWVGVFASRSNFRGSGFPLTSDVSEKSCWFSICSSFFLLWGWESWLPSSLLAGQETWFYFYVGECSGF